MTRHGITFPAPADRPTAPAYIQTLPWYDWGRSNLHPAGDYWNMVWAQRNRTRRRFANEAAPLLLLNEPEYSWQANMSPAQVADAWALYSDYAGPVYVGGYGYEYLDQFQEARRLYRGPEYWAGLHVHVYAKPWEFSDERILRSALHPWRKEAGDRPIVVSEWGFLPVDGYIQCAARQLERLLRVIEEELQPELMFWFSWRMPDDSQNTPGIDWRHTNVFDGIIGQAWRRIVFPRPHKAWLPFVYRS